MNILITGATGFIGSHVAQQLRRESHDVYPLTRPWRIPAGRFDACIHLAWYVEPGKYLESPLNHQCVADSLALAHALVDGGCRRLVVAGTCFETAAPNTVYAQSKLKLFTELQKLPLNLAWLRFYYLYGPREDPRRFVPTVINGLLRGQVVPVTNANAVRDYLHVADVGRAVTAIAQSALTGIVDIGSGMPVTVRGLAGTIGELVGQPALLAFDAAGSSSRIVADNARLVGLGWQPQFTLATGLQQTIEWWRSAPKIPPAESTAQSAR